MAPHDPTTFPLIRDLLVARTFRRDSAATNTSSWLGEPAVEKVLGAHLPPVLQFQAAESAERTHPPSTIKAKSQEAQGEKNDRQRIGETGELVIDGGEAAKWETTVVVSGLEKCWGTLRQDLVDLFEDHRV
jgi:hypothetical protein